MPYPVAQGSFPSGVIAENFPNHYAGLQSQPAGLQSHPAVPSVQEQTILPSMQYQPPCPDNAFPGVALRLPDPSVLYSEIS